MGATLALKGAVDPLQPFPRLFGSPLRMSTEVPRRVAVCWLNWSALLASFVSLIVPVP